MAHMSTVPNNASAKRIAVWLEPSQAEFVGETVEAAGLTLVGAGSPSKGQSAAAATRLKCEPFDDLRSALTEMPTDIIWLASIGDFGTKSDSLDARAVMVASGRGVRVASTEPVPASALLLGPGGWAGENTEGLAGPMLRFVGTLRGSRWFREASEVLASFGQPRLVQVETWSAPEHGSLAARLLGAMDLLFGLLAEPESIDATIVAPGWHTGHRPNAPETLAHLHGDLSATMRFSDGRAGVVSASNAAGRWNTTVTLVSHEGRLRLYDDGFEWIGPDGAKRDELRMTGRTRGGAKKSHAVTAAADSLGRLVDVQSPDFGPMPLEPVLAMSQAALLSARTGHPESPATIRRMMLTP